MKRYELRIRIHFAYNIIGVRGKVRSQRIAQYTLLYSDNKTREVNQPPTTGISPECLTVVKLKGLLVWGGEGDGVRGRDCCSGCLLLDCIANEYDSLGCTVLPIFKSENVVSLFITPKPNILITWYTRVGIYSFNSYMILM